MQYIGEGTQRFSDYIPSIEEEALQICDGSHLNTDYIPSKNNDKAF